MKMRNHENRSLLQIAIALALATALAGCGKKDEAPAASTAAAPPVEAAPVAVAPADTQAPVIPPAAAVPTSWTAEAMEELLAPVALYPDPILMQVLAAAGNPQEVLDAGNWLLQNQGLKGNDLEQAASKIGFTPPTRAILQFPATLDMMCQEMAWTTELGQAFVADQQGVLDAVQRLRFQAQDVGNLKSSPQMNVSMQDQGGQQVIYLKPADPEVVYVPQYDPVAVYAPAPAATTTTVVQEGHSTGALITTGLLAFGAGMLVNEIFDDDDDWNDRYYPRYGYGGGYYYNRYPYRPAYGNGYYPNNGYNRPPNYNNGWQNNGNINTGDITINTGGNRPNVGGNRPDFNDSRLRTGSSPISKAKPNRDMSKINQRPARPAGADDKRPGTGSSASDWKGQSGYAGAKKSPTGKPSADIADKARDQARTGGKQPKEQGGYAGAKPSTRDIQRPDSKPSTRDIQRPDSKPSTRDIQRPDSKPSTRDIQRPDSKPNTRDVQRPDSKPSTRDIQRPDSKPNTRDVQRPDSKPNTRDVQRPDSKPYTRDVKRPQQAQNRSKDSADRGYGGGNASRQKPSRQNSSGGGGYGGGSMSGASRGGSDRAASQRGKQSSGGSSQQKSRR
jgi:predicted small lipoprotein YifL